MREIYSDSPSTGSGESEDVDVLGLAARSLLQLVILLMAVLILGGALIGPGKVWVGDVLATFLFFGVLLVVTFLVGVRKESPSGLTAWPSSTTQIFGVMLILLGAYWLSASWRVLSGQPLGTWRAFDLSLLVQNHGPTVPAALFLIGGLVSAWYGTRTFRTRPLNKESLRDGREPTRLGQPSSVPAGNVTRKQHVDARRHATRPQTLVGKLGFFHRWLYYRCYRHEARAWGKYSRRYWDKASLNVCILLLFNVAGLVFLSIAFFDVRLPTDVPKWVIGGIFAVIALGYTLYWRGRYKRVLAEFSDETTEERRNGSWLFACYIVGSMVFFIAAAGTMIIIGTLKGQLHF